MTEKEISKEKTYPYEKKRRGRVEEHLVP